MDEPATPKPKLTLCQRIAVLLRWHEQCVDHFRADSAKRQRHADFAATAKAAHARICKRDTLPTAHIPILAEVLLYASEIRLSETEAHKFFNHFEAAGWKMGGRTKIKNWQARLKNWKADNEERAADKKGGPSRKKFEEGF